MQWVEGDASKAENSFFKINQQAAPIDKTELVLLESRKKPNCIASRAIVRSGKGHKYWSSFSKENQTAIQNLARDINEILFAPKLQTPIKTLDIPIGGKNYSAQTLPLILDFVNIVNGIPSSFKDLMVDDETGDETVAVLTKARRVAWRINSIHASSLGLHPVVYFYSQEGRHKVASFYATVLLMLLLEKHDGFAKFTRVRKEFEEVLSDYDYLVQQINRRYRSALGSYTHIADYYLYLIDTLDVGLSKEDAIAGLLKTEKFNYLTLNLDAPEITSADFTSERKSAVFIKSAFASAPKCSICNGFIHRNALTIDHIVRREDGGVGSVGNGQIAHPYCNTTYKN